MRDIVQLRPIELDTTRRRLSTCLTIEDLRRVAERHTPRPVYDYVYGAADEELTSEANIAAFRRRRLRPRVLADVSSVDTSVSLFGRNLPFPVVLGPTGYTRMMHADGEIGVARSAARAGIPYTLSTMATTGIEDLRDTLASAPDLVTADPDLWFQLYILKDRERAYALVDRTWEAGFRTLVVTVDTVVTGNRLRDTRNGLTMPPSLTPSTIMSVGLKPGYWYRLLSGPALGYANFSELGASQLHQTAQFFDPAINWADIATLRSRWPGRILVKGPLGPADARRAVDLGVDGLQLSNHGGRQLDRCVPAADMIVPVREEVGPSLPLVVDSGIRTGTDIAVALALGADAAALGRTYLYGLMAGGEAGVDHALTILAKEFLMTMRLLGVTSVAELRKRGKELLAPDRG